MTICIEDLGKKLVGKRIDGIDNVVMNGKPNFATFALPRLRLVDPLGDVTYLVLSPQLEANIDPDRHATFMLTATVNFIIQNVNQEEESNDYPTDY
jgi:hypothetical protein